MTLEAEVKKAIALADKHGLKKAAAFFRGFLIKQKTIEKRKRTA